MTTLLCLIATLLPAAGRPSRPWEPQRIPAEVYVDRSGLPELIVGSTFNGAVVGTVVTQALFSDADQTRAATGTVLGVGAGILIPMLATGGDSIVPAQAAFYNLGQRWGVINGLLIPALWGGREDWHYAAGVTGMTALGVVGTLIGWPRLELSPGQVSALGTFHAFSTIATSLVTLLFDVVPDSGFAFAAPVLLVSNASIAAAWVLRDDFDIDRRRVIWTDIGGYGGLGLGLATGLALVGQGAHPHREQVIAGTMLGGMAGGLMVGYVLSSGLDDYRRAADRDSYEVVWELPAARPQPAADGGVGWAIDLVRGRW